MYQTFLADASFFSLLTALDRSFCDQVQASGCPFCSRRLDRSPYCRKPRGVPAECDEPHMRRESLCCSTCRRRVTPFSLRFLGRRFYVSVVVVMMAMRSGRDASRLLARSSKQLSPLNRRTIGRWRRWWREEVPLSRWFRRVRGALPVDIEAEGLPSSLLDRLAGDAGQRLLSLLRFLAPATSRSCPLECAF